MSEFRTFVVPYDFSEHARAALDTAIDLASRLGAEVHLFHVVAMPAYAYGFPPYGPPAPAAVNLMEMRERAMNALRGLVAELEPIPIKLEPHVADGSSVADAVCDGADGLDADLVVMGTHGRTGLAHVFLGSVAERTLRKASCPVLTVRAPEEVQKD